MTGNIINAQSCNIIQSLCKSCCRDVIRSSSLKLQWRTFKRSFLKTNILYHFATPLIRRQLIQPCFFSIKNTNTCRTINFMPTEYKEIAIKILHIHSKVRSTLCTINHYWNIMFMCNTNNILNRINCSKDVTYMTYTYDFRT